MALKGRFDDSNATPRADNRDEAEGRHQALLVENSNNPEALYGLGVIAWQAGHFDEAQELLTRAVGLSPTAANFSMLGEIERMRRNFASAQAALRRAIEVDPNCADAYNNIGALMIDQGRHVDAASVLMRATRANPEGAMAHFNLGIAFKELNYLDESIVSYRRAIKLQPGFVEAHVNLALALLLAGQLDAGFEEYEWRLKLPALAPVAVNAMPMWDGTLDPQGTLLVTTEQGLGDTIQFARYIPFIAKEGMRVVVQCPPALEDLLQCMEGIASTYRPDEPLPQCTARMPLLSLPRLFKTTIDKVPRNVPYFLPPFSKVRQWRQRLDALGETIKVGLRWSGNPLNSDDNRRSIPLEMFSALAGMPSVTFIGLNNESVPEKDKAAAQAIGLVDYSADLADFIDTAALMSHLDLVISVDTAVLHLAGALGRPAWGLVKFAPHWSWLLERSDSPWYPSVQLFRQSRADDWQPIVDRVVATLAQSMQTSTEQEG